MLQFFYKKLNQYKTFIFNASLIVFSLLSLAGALVLSYKHIDYKNKVYQNWKSDLFELTKKSTKNLDNLLLQVTQPADQFAQEITHGLIAKTDMDKKLKSIIKNNDLVYGGTVTYSPFGFDPKKRLHSSYMYKHFSSPEPIYLDLAQEYDYTKDEYDWYTVPMKEGNRWGEPYWDEAGETYMITYSSVFYTEKEQQQGKKLVPNGVITLDISLKKMKNIVENLDIGPNGFGALVTQKGNYLYHPVYEYVQNGKNIKDIAIEKNDSDRFILAKKAAQQASGVINHISTTSGEASWLIYAPVKSSGWSLQNTFIKKDIPIDVDVLRKKIIGILLLSIISIISFASLFLKERTPKRIGYLSAFTSLILIISIGILWDLALSYRNSEHKGGLKISDRATLASEIKNYQKQNADKELADLIEIPTGLYIDTMKFISSNDIAIAGKIWQIYPQNFPEKYSKLPYIAKSRNFKLSDPEKHIQNGKEVRLWRFQTEIREKIDYSRYPLEVEHLSIKLQPALPDGIVVLVPDIASYRLTTAALRPGIDKSVFIPGWKVTNSFFKLKKPTENMVFGIERNFDQDPFPGLYFEIGIKRIFLDAFFSNMMPLIVVSIILFLVALMPTNVDISRVLAICVSVFFVVVFAHLDIRKNISIDRIFYLEYFYFVTYFAILVVPINAFRASLNIRSRFYEYQNGLIPKAIYWPSILGVFCIITAWKFY